MHGTYDSHLIALPFMLGCGVRVIRSASKCVAFLSLKWRVKGGPRLVDMPGAQWSAALGCHSGITSWSSWPGFWTSPIKYFHYFCFITLHTMTSSTFSALLPLCGGESPGHRWIPLTGASDAELWRFLFCFFDLRLNKRLSKQWRRRLFWDAIVLIMMSLQCFLWNWNWFHLLVLIHCLLLWLSMGSTLWNWRNLSHMP